MTKKKLEKLEELFDTGFWHSIFRFTSAAQLSYIYWKYRFKASKVQCFIFRKRVEEYQFNTDAPYWKCLWRYFIRLINYTSTNSMKKQFTFAISYWCTQIKNFPKTDKLFAYIVGFMPEERIWQIYKIWFPNVLESSLCIILCQEKMAYLLKLK